MRRSTAVLLLVSLSFLFGCATKQHVLLAKTQFNKDIVTIAQVAEEDNSSQMDGYLAAALKKEGLTQKARLPAGTRKSQDVDALISYVDVWRWDVVMYIQSIRIKLFDAESGDLLVSGEWQDSELHGFRSAQKIVEGVVAEMFSKLKTATKKN